MLPCKKRRTTLTESPQHQGNQEEDDLDLQSAVKPESDQVKDLGSVSLSWSPSHGRAADLEVQDAGIQLGMEDPSLSSRMLTEDTNVAVLEAVDVAISQGLTLPSLESSQPVNTHLGKVNSRPIAQGEGRKLHSDLGQLLKKTEAIILSLRSLFQKSLVKRSRKKEVRHGRSLASIYLVSTSLSSPLRWSLHSLQCLYRTAFLKGEPGWVWNWSCGTCKCQHGTV